MLTANTRRRCPRGSFRACHSNCDFCSPALAPSHYRTLIFMLKLPCHLFLFLPLLPRLLPPSFHITTSSTTILRTQHTPTSLCPSTFQAPNAAPAAVRTAWSSKTSSTSTRHRGSISRHGKTTLSFRPCMVSDTTTRLFDPQRERYV